MNTFLPYSDFTMSAQSLDNRRLGKQRVENLQIIRVLTGLTKGWRNHPATLMWDQHIYSLFLYQIAIVAEWQGRGYKDTCLDKTINVLDEYPGQLTYVQPPWLGDQRLHISHQSNLIRKDPSFYIPKFGPDVPPDLPYFWPLPYREPK